MNDFTPLYDLKDVELEVVRLRNVPEYGVVGRLLAGFDLPQLHSGVRRGGLQHLHKQLRRHEVAARGRRKISTARQRLERTQIYLLISLRLHQ